MDGDRLKLAFGPPRERPKNFKDEEAQVLALTRDKAAKVPDLTKVKLRGKETWIKPARQWLGRVGDMGVEKKCPEKPIATRAEFEKVWKALRGTEEIPKVDFGKQFIVVRTSPVLKLAGIELLLEEGEEEAVVGLVAKAGEKFKGLSYGIAAFHREQVDVVDGRIVSKIRKK